MAAQIATIETVSAEFDRHIQEEREREARDAPAYLKPGVYPQVGGSGGPRAEPDRR